MNYFTESLISLPTYISDNIFKPEYGLFPLQDILSEPVSSKDRRDLNKIYEHSDIFVKRNSIVTYNNKKQKKLLGTAIQSVTQSLIHKTSKEDSLQPPLQMIGRQNAFFQEIHPADVEKSHEDNIFDYRLHLKLAKGEQIFKVEEIKRKTKKRNIAGKECECCGKQVMKNHQCKHTFCEQKCGKVIKRVDSKKDAGSSMMSDSKDENWSDQNYNEEKAVRVHTSKKDNEKKLKMNRRQTSPSNKDLLNLGEPSEVLLASIEKLLEPEQNNFTYKIIEIKENESDEDEEEKDDFDEDKEMNLEDWQNKDLFAEDQMRDEENEELLTNEKHLTSQALLKTVNLQKNKDQQTFNLHSCENQLKLPKNQNPENQHKTENSNPFIENCASLLQKQYEKVPQQRLSQNIQHINQKFLSIDEKINSNEALAESNIMIKMQLQLIYNQTKQVEMGQKTVPQSSKQSKSNGSEARKQYAQKTTQQNIVNASYQNHNSISIKSQNFQTPSSDSDQDENRQKEVQQQAQVEQISADNDFRKKNINNLSSSSQEKLDTEKNNNKIDSKQVQNNLNQDIESIPDFNSQNSLDDQIDQIIDPQKQEAIENARKMSLPRNSSDISSKEISEKLSKKDSKKIKIAEKEKLISNRIQDIDPILNLEQKSKESQGENSSKAQNQYHEYKEQGKVKGRGKGKGQGMGRGKGIFQQELDIYQQDSQMLESSDEQSQQIEGKHHSEQSPVEDNLKIAFPQCQFGVNPLSTSPIIHQTLTPKRQIPNMETIIKQIQLETVNNAYEKGLGRGKIFGRGLGVLQETQELEKEVEKDGLQIKELTQSEKLGTNRKKVKLLKQKYGKNNQQENQQFSVLNQQQDFCDEFQKLIDEEEEQKFNAPDGLYLNKSCQNDKIEAMYYQRYLEKRQSIAVRLGSKLQFSEEELQQQDLQRQQNEGQQREENIKIGVGRLEGQEEVISQANELDEEEKQLEQMIDLNDENSFASKSKPYDQE